MCRDEEHPNDAEIIPSVLNVSLGTINLREFHVVRGVTKIIPHPGPNFNLALLKLDKSVLPEQSGPTTSAIYRINYICLPEEGARNYHEEEAIMSGFGNTNNTVWNGAKTNYELRKAVVTIESQEDCGRFRNRFPTNTICSPIPQEKSMICFVSIDSFIDLLIVIICIFVRVTMARV